MTGRPSEGITYSVSLKTGTGSNASGGGGGVHWRIGNGPGSLGPVSGVSPAERIVENSRNTAKRVTAEEWWDIDTREDSRWRVGGQETKPFDSTLKLSASIPTGGPADNPMTTFHACSVVIGKRALHFAL
jgi:hypothetical protein